MLGDMGICQTGWDKIPSFADRKSWGLPWVTIYNVELSTLRVIPWPLLLNITKNKKYKFFFSQSPWSMLGSEHFCTINSFILFALTTWNRQLSVCFGYPIQLVKVLFLTPTQRSIPSNPINSSTTVLPPSEWAVWLKNHWTWECSIPIPFPYPV